MAAITVTATAGGAGVAQGLALQVKVLTGAKPVSGQTGATAHAENASPDEVSITTTTAGSYVYQGISSALAASPASGCTNLYSHTDATHNETYAAFRTTSATGTPGATTVGNATAGDAADNIAAAEILAATTIAEDASSPAGIGIDTASAVTSASFSPPAGSLLVAMTGCNGSASALETMTVTDSSGLTWHPLAESNSAATCYAGVWIADVPAAGGAVAFPPAPQQSRWRRRKHRPQQVIPALPQMAVPSAAGIQGAGSINTATAVQQAGASLGGTGSLATALSTYITGVSASTSTQAGYFTDQNGNPKLWVGDWMEGLLTNAGRWSGSGGGTWQQDLDTYCSERAAQGVSVVLIEPVGALATGSAFDNGNTWDNVPPFVTGTDPNSGLNNTYWTRLDYLINTSAIKNGMTVVIILDIEYNDAAGQCYNGWTNAQYQQYGALLGARYKNSPNVVWVCGDDTQPGTFDTQFTSFLTGVSGAGDTHMVAALWVSESTSRYICSTNASAAWGTSHSSFDYVYTYDASYYCVEYAYGEVANEGASALLPVALSNGYHYGGGTTYSTADRSWRQELWWTLAAGARGCLAYSVNNYNWSAGSQLATITSDWSFANTLPHVVSAFTSWTDWNKLLPDLSSTFVTAGRGSRVAGITSGSGTAYEPSFANSWVAASITPAGTLAVCYLPNSTTITVNTSKLAAGWTATWVDPVSGATSSAGTSGTYNSTAKGANSQGDPDWVLVFQAPPAVAGAATLAGTGALTAPVTQLAGATLSGTASLNAPAVQAVPATLAGAGSLGTTATQAVPATLAGAGSLGTTATQGSGGTLGGAGFLATVVIQGAGAVLSGTGALSTAVTQDVTAALSAAGSLSAAGYSAGAATLGGAGSIGTAGGGAGQVGGQGSVTTGPALLASAALSATGTLATAASLAAPGTLAAAGSLGAVVTLRAPAGLAGTATLTAPAAQGAPAVLAAAGSVTAPAVTLAPATLAAAATLTATAGQGAGLPGTGSLSTMAAQGTSAPLTGTGTLAAATAQLAPTALAGAGLVTAPAAALTPAALAGTGIVAAAAVQAAGASLAGTAVLGTLATIGVPATLNGTGLLAGGAVQGGQIGGQGTISAPSPIMAAPAILAGTGLLSTAAAQAVPVTLAAAGSVSTVVSQLAPAPLAAAGSLTGSGAIAGAALLTGTGVLAAAGTVSGGAGAVLAATGSLTPATVLGAGAVLAAAGLLAAAAVQGAWTMLAGAGSLAALGVQHPPQVKGFSTSAVTRPQASTSAVTRPQASTSAVTRPQASTSGVS